MSAKATPGPWVYDPEFPANVYSDDVTGSIIATTTGFAFAKRSAEVEAANARLIAAAPDLLEALRTTLQALEATRNGGPLPDFAAWEESARAAIAKATGGQS